ncbi:MAG: AraC family transcriptional regulator ligand-binding domain-containing protein [Paucibacter sp.]|nr:AraC family transcriptional regulator ligand-binding domain-containing protein [Roseateles sp.]
MGIPGESLFRGLGLTAADLDVPGFKVTHHEAHSVVRRALRLLHAPNLGLTLGMHTRITERGAMALGLMAATTLGEAMALPLQFPGSAGYLMAVHTERSKHLHLMFAEPMPGTDDIAPFLVDIMFAGSVRIRRQLTQTHFAPMRVELVRPRPTNAEDYEQHFACTVQFGRSRNLLATHAADLAYPLPLANAMAYRLARQLLERDMERVISPSALGMAIERSIQRALPLIATPAELAISLNLSERSLRRKLAQEGLGFRGLLDEARKARALELMAGARRSISDIATQTGFSDVRAFSRAFRRWTGEAPSALQAAVRSAKDSAND